MIFTMVWSRMEYSSRRRLTNGKSLLDLSSSSRGALDSRLEEDEAEDDEEEDEEEKEGETVSTIAAANRVLVRATFVYIRSSDNIP